MQKWNSVDNIVFYRENRSVIEIWEGELEIVVGSTLREVLNVTAVTKAVSIMSSGLEIISIVLF